MLRVFVDRRGRDRWVGYNLKLSGMGSICDDVRQAGGVLEIVVDTSTRSFYEPAVAEDPYLHHLIEDVLNNVQNFRNFGSDKQLLKHKAKDLYYYGQWDPNGYPKGRGIQYKKDQYYYYGEFDSVPSGKGLYSSIAHKFIYEGEISYGRIEGLGKVRSTQNYYTYEGEFNKYAQLVTGTAIINYPGDESKSYTVVLKNYPENKAKITYRDGRSYQGEISFSNYAPQGMGVARFPNGSVYEGMWQNGEYHGQGRFVWPDGSSYLGNYCEGRKQGFGTFHYASKKYYRGQWEDGVQNGEGILFSQYGKIIKKGLWIKGQLGRVDAK